VSRVIVLGAGIVGTAAAWDLIRRGHDVTAADADASRVAATAADLDVHPVVLDVTDVAAVQGAVAGHDLVVSAVPYVHGYDLATAAIEDGAHYLDFGGNPAVVARQLQLDAEAVAGDIAVIPDCGLAPGLANVVAEGLLTELGGTADSVQLRVGALPQQPVGALGYQLAFSPHGLINEYAEPCEVIEDGIRTTVEPLTRFEALEWTGWGPLEAFSTAGGTSTMASSHQNAVTSLEYKTLRYPGHGRIFRAMYELGLFDEEPRRIGGTTLAPRDTLLAALSSHLPSGEPDVVLVRVWATRGDETITAQCEDLHDGQFSALARTTAFPATALADLLLRGECATRGVVTMNQAVASSHLLAELDAVAIAFERAH